MRIWLPALLACMACSEASSRAPSAPADAAPAFAVLVFSRTEGFRHDSIPQGIAAIREQGRTRGFTVDATEDAGAFSDASLARYRVVVFLSTTGDVLAPDQERAFERFIRGGGGFVGIHAAADTEYDWPFYGELIGAYFAGHPDIQQATIRVAQPPHPSTAGLPATWTRRDEWYNFRRSPSGHVTVLATLDESSYTGGTMGGDHPIVWAQTFEGGRAWYTGGGHTAESFSEPLFADHLGRGILWAAARL